MPTVPSCIQPPGQRERRQQRMARPAPPRAPQPGHEDLPAAARLPDITPVPRPGRQRPGTRRTGRAGNPASRPGAAYASTASGHGETMADGRHALGSLLAIFGKRGEEGSSTFNGGHHDPDPPRQARQRRRQRARPGNRPGRSDSQAAPAEPSPPSVTKNGAQVPSGRCLKSAPIYARALGLVAGCGAGTRPCMVPARHGRGRRRDSASGPRSLRGSCQGWRAAAA